MMGSITNYMWIQNDPKGMTVEQANDWVYWRSRLRALAFSTAFSFWWKLGPTGEAAVGHNGDHFFYDKGVLTNETGWVELVTTPLGGLDGLWARTHWTSTSSGRLRPNPTVRSPCCWPASSPVPRHGQHFPLPSAVVSRRISGQGEYLLERPAGARRGQWPASGRRPAGIRY